MKMTIISGIGSFKLQWILRLNIIENQSKKIQIYYTKWLKS